MAQEDKKVGSKAKTPNKTQPPQPEPTDEGNIVTLSDARVDDLIIQINKLEQRTDKNHGEQKTIIVATVIALLFIVATIAVEVIFFNAAFRERLDEVQGQHYEDYKSLRNDIDQSEDSLRRDLTPSPQAPATPSQAN